MNNRSAFDLDCNPVIPECGFKCPKCIQEIESTLTSMQGSLPKTVFVLPRNPKSPTKPPVLRLSLGYGE